MFHSADVVNLINDGVNAKHKEALAAELYKEAQTQRERDFVIYALKNDLANNYKKYVFRLDYFLKLADAKTDLFEMLMNPNFSNDCLAYYYDYGVVSSICENAGFDENNIKHNVEASKYEFLQSDKERKKKAFIAISLTAIVVFMIFYKAKFKKLINLK